jgi:hypothetical protein|tara:strand:+ start:59 stop:271 length:213 start_codon:yes stop_codon:yes gene_type:complete
MAIKPKFFQLTNDLRNLLLLIKSIGGDYPHQSLVEMTLSSNQYHKNDREWLNKVREWHIVVNIKLNSNLL